MHAGPRKVLGFTLLEVLVAVGIFALTSAMAYAGLTRMLETRERLNSEQQFWRSVTLAFAQIEDDLAQVRPRTTRNTIGNAEPAFRGQPVDPRAISEPSMQFIRGGVFVLGEGSGPDLAHVGYRLREGQLLRLVWPALDQAAVAEPREMPLLANATVFETRFRAANGGWVDRWPSGTDPREIPGAVEIKFAIEGRGEFTRVFLVNN